MFTQLILASLFLGILPPSDCRIIQDKDRRGFDDRRPILLDIDQDGTPDEITARVYRIRTIRKPRRGGRAKLGEAHWIAFDMKTGRGRMQRSFFRYQYGSERADYWVYALVPCDVNKDGQTDLIFYSGDDTSEETIVLLNHHGRFRVHSRKVSADN